MLLLKTRHNKYTTIDNKTMKSVVYVVYQLKNCLSRTYTLEYTGTQEAIIETLNRPAPIISGRKKARRSASACTVVPK
jgi:hypothetical protein